MVVDGVEVAVVVGGGVDVGGDVVVALAGIAERLADGVPLVGPVAVTSRGRGAGVDCAPTTAVPKLSTIPAHAASTTCVRLVPISLTMGLPSPTRHGLIGSFRVRCSARART